MFRKAAIGPLPPPGYHGSMKKGARAEELACDYLRAQGLLIVARNWRWPGGEVDIVARDGDTLVFVEVKYRESSSHGRPAEAVGPEKRSRLLRSARAFLGPKLHTLPVRFDVVEVTPQGVNHIRGAFDEPCWPR